MPRDSLLADITGAGLCAGCGLCASISEGSATMEIDADGYLRPMTARPLGETQRARVRDTCPGLVIEHESRQSAYHPLWGPLLATQVGWAKDPAVRRAGSSGGVISALLTHLLEQNRVDFVMHTGADLDAPLRNRTRISRTPEEAVANAGSRYAPSAPLEHIVDQLSKPERFAFVGKPCDVAALRRYARHDARVNEKIPYVISFMCAGIPSEHGSLEILARFGAPASELASFRYRGDGWPGSTRAEMIDGHSYEMTYQESWGEILNRHLQLRCKICPDGVGEFADIVCADAWYGDERGYPDFSEHEGRSLILVRTERGAGLLEEAVREGAVMSSDLDPEAIRAMQPYQANRKEMVASRVAAMASLGRRTPRFRNLALGRLAWRAGLRRNAKSFFGMLRRLWATPTNTRS